MKVLLRCAFALFALATFASLSHAQSKEALELSNRLYERSGLAVQLGSLTEQFEEGFALNRGKVPDEFLTAIGQAAKTSFDPATLRKDIVRSLAEKMSAADTRQVLAWLDGDVGRRVTLAEERASTAMTAESMDAFFEREKADPPSEKRRQLIKDLMDSTKAVDFNANLIETVSLGVALGIDATQPVQKRIGVAGLRARLREAMPSAQLRASLSASLPAMMGFAYGDVSDADLAAYVHFNRSPLGMRYNEAMSAAVAEALARASVRIGELLDATPKERT